MPANQMPTMPVNRGAYPPNQTPTNPVNQKPTAPRNRPAAPSGQRPYAGQMPPVPAYAQKDPLMQPEKKNSKLHLFIAIGAAAAILIVLLCLLIPKLAGVKRAPADDPTDPLDYMFAYINHYDYDSLYNAVQPEYWKSRAADLGISVDRLKTLVGDSNTILPEYAGRSVRYKIVDQDEYHGSRVDDLLDRIGEDMEARGIDTEKIESAIIYELKLTVDGEPTENNESYFMTVYNYDGYWYLWLN